LGGIGAVYLIGIPVMAWNLDLPLWTAAALNLAFIPGDLIKVVVTVLVANQVHRAYPGLISRIPRRSAVTAE
jgi:biotin transport system substrate-specific component